MAPTKQEEDHLENDSSKNDAAKGKEEWGTSWAKSILYKDLVNGTISLDTKVMPPRMVRQHYLNRPEFQQFLAENSEAQKTRWRSNLARLRNKIIKKKHTSNNDAQALAHDRLIHPKPTTDHKGIPHWDGSEAQRLMNLDIDNNKHKRFTKAAFHLSRAEYATMPKKLFRDRVYKELRKRKKFVKKNKSGRPKILHLSDSDDSSATSS